MSVEMVSAVPNRLVANTTNGSSYFSPEIQSLRGVAVLLVLIYHIFPEYLSGGYIGVDVFFVISGYLITGHLAREYSDLGRVSLSRFYIRRVRRLVPAATLVLFCTLILLPFFLPRTQWDDSINEIIASVFYVENWALYVKQLDYLAADYSPTPVQHYWSLSVEEQFYLIWPLLFFISAFVKLPIKKMLALHLMIAVVIGSFVYSVFLSQDSRTGAYFHTFSRIWELGVGGIFAILKPKIRIGTRLSLTASAIGIVTIILSAILFDSHTSFPGLMALIPVFGTILFLFALGDFRRFIPLQLLLNRPLVYVGDISYSLYLWHWVLIVFTVASGVYISFIIGLALILISLLLAHFTKIHVEDRFRGNQGDHNAKTAIFIAVGAFGIISMISLSFNDYMQHLLDKDKRLYYSASNVDFPGALVFADDFYVPKDATRFIPSPAMARDDISAVYKDGCHSNEASVEPIFCTYGNLEALETIALVGDSHAAQWLPALEVVATNQKLKLLTFTKSSCPLVGITIYLRERSYDECDRWYNNVLQKLKQIKPRAVITTHYVGHLAKDASSREDSVERLAGGLEVTWQVLLAADIKVIAIKDSPKVGIDVPDCLAKKESTLESCSVSREKAFETPDSILVAAGRSEKVSLIDLTDKICDVETCPAIVGNVLVYRDGNHLTSTYVKSLSYELSVQLNSSGLF